MNYSQVLYRFTLFPGVCIPDGEPSLRAIRPDVSSISFEKFGLLANTLLPFLLKIVKCFKFCTKDYHCDFATHFYDKSTAGDKISLSSLKGT